MNALITAFWLMLPAYIPNNCAALFGGGTPLDRGSIFQDGRRTLGDGKTFRGTFAGTVCGLLIGLLQNQIAPYFDLPTFGSGFGQLPILFALSLGAMMGDIVAAFFKRRMGLQRGAPLFIIDQLDFVVGAWICAMLISPGWFFQNFTIDIMIIVLIITPILHRASNIIGYKMGTKREPW
ncbi:MAG TPA: CDP-2,3-bis-(O-geranylgeranyl)-sn-glycerol synthase [Methanothrix sp.]|nr:CDP-2,3-bis-(O-geranylgeranyl)-sn-glycerol synthase [Methanothrix sp.]HPC90230.1 CDP-2,3-bis-(O-geranylgeranyl)-sn-glycerol synthase [Methanothrix sp.]HQI68612.1 CDP-2,3-bis-(O-geranylgeranyl)-sn-glycerol synthase [Methanothrix sp.]HRS85625.1 CDP-2,3-bis-(O-geranylgeranyl)-sn-glycerol synthase [Methanothrix sp.]HRT17637.1 CDP-2,3-bis-(O-geranylgeranyl)-sn-glycerol synthase [Methanothrix sp.]